MARPWGNKNSHTLLVRMQIGTTIIEGYLAVTIITTYASTFDPGIYSEDTPLPPLYENTHAQGYSLMHCL